jgi:hypothetical protein
MQAFCNAQLFLAWDDIMATPDERADFLRKQSESFSGAWVPLAAALGRQCDCHLIFEARAMLIRALHCSHDGENKVTGHQLAKHRHWRARAPASGTQSTVLV